MAFTTAVTLHASATRSTGTSQASAVDLASKTALELVVNLTAASGAGSVAIKVQTSVDGLTGWRDADGEVANFTATGTQRVVFAGCDRYARVSWTITGFSDATFDVLGDAVLVYATPADFHQYGMPEQALEGITVAAKHRALKAATNRFDRALPGAGFTLPLTAWGDDIRRDCCALAAYDVLTTRGVDPDTIDSWIRLRYVELVGEPGKKGELQLIAEGKLIPPGVEDSTPDDSGSGSSGAAVVSQPRRGW